MAQLFSPAANALARGTIFGGLMFVALVVWAGRFANNAWLQELPGPLTKITWDNAAYVSPRTAKQLGLASGDMVEVSLGGRSLAAPVWIMPGQADGGIGLTLGYGRTRAGSVGSGVGHSA
jgi:molybdopterin-containing oxidoreductase family iron-sulfur binding subunit